MASHMNILVLLVFSMCLCSGLAAPVSSDIDADKEDEKAYSIFSRQLNLEEEADKLDDNAEEDLGADDEEEFSEQQDCVPNVPGLRCTTDICGDPLGIIRNCCVEFCQNFGGGAIPPFPGPFSTPTALFVD